MSEKRPAAAPDRLRPVLELAGAFFELDAELRIVDVSDSSAQALRRPRADLLGQPLAESFSDPERALLNDSLHRVLAEQSVVTLELGAAAAPEPCWFELRACPSDCGGIFALLIEITERKRSEQSVREGEHLYRAIGETIDFGVWVCAPDGKNTYASDSFLKLLGITQEQCSNFGWGNLLHPDDAALTLSAWKECVRTGSMWDRKHRFRGADGNWHLILARGMPVKNDRGEVLYWAGINLDISSLSKAEAALRESEARYRAFFQNLNEGVLVYEAVRDEQGEVTDWLIQDLNRTALEISGWNYQAVVGKSHRLLSSVEAAAEHGRSLHSVLTTGQPSVVERDFAGRSFLVSSFRLGDSAVALAGLEITETKRAEAALRLSNQRRSSFLALLSHELRNPLAPINNCLHILDQTAPGSPPYNRARQVLQRQVDHLARLVDDLLDISRIDHGKLMLKRTPIDAREVAFLAYDDFCSIFEQRRIHHSIDIPKEPLWIDADAGRVTQIIGNLLSNASKFTDAGGSVQLILGAQSGLCEIRVVDSGVGIDSQLLERIFEPFEQAERTRGQTVGTLGLGLALVKNLVELHGGSVRALSKGTGQGAEFVINLPSVAAPTPSPAPDSEPKSTPEPEPTTASSGLRILIIEDNQDAGEMLAELLQLLGHSAELAADGHSGIARTRATKPDVLICDVGLPDISGYDVIRKLRAGDGVEGLFAIALTGYALPEDRERAREAGFDGHLAKPPGMDALNELLATAAAKKQ